MVRVTSRTSPSRQADAEAEPERRRDQPDQERLGEDDRDDLGARDAERPQPSRCVARRWTTENVIVL